MTDAEAALLELRDAFAEIRAFLDRHGMASEWTKIRYLANLALTEDEPPETVLGAIDRAYGQVMAHRESFADVFVRTPDGDVDRLASRELTALVDRMADILDTWEGDEDE